MNKVAIFTAIYGGHDTLKPTVEIPGVDWHCFHDGSLIFMDKLVEHTWQGRLIPGRFRHPRMNAKWIRMNPELLLPEYDVTIWIDASIQITRPDFAEWVLAAVERSRYGFALFEHPDRKDIYAEAAESAKYGKYAGEPVMEQVQSYREQGLPNDHGLWATGIMGRRKSDLLWSINQQWMNENIRWTWQDQLSLPYVLWKHRSRFPLPGGQMPEPLPGNLWACPYFTRVWQGPDR